MRSCELNYWMGFASANRQSFLRQFSCSSNSAKVFSRQSFVLYGMTHIRLRICLMRIFYQYKCILYALSWDNIFMNFTSFGNLHGIVIYALAVLFEMILEIELWKPLNVIKMDTLGLSNFGTISLIGVSFERGVHCIFLLNATLM